jgi:bacillithiol biosynthesis deacetylase BshB1
MNLHGVFQGGDQPPRPADDDRYDALVFGAHPDDAEMAMGGTMIRLTDAGYRVLSISLTRGQMSTKGTVDDRMKEFADASAVIGCDHLALDFMDTEVENRPEDRRPIAALIREHRPRIVFAPYHTNPYGELFGIANVDHYATGSLVRDGAKMARLDKVVPGLPPHQIDQLYFYMLPRDVHPNLLVDVSDVIERTFDAIRCYRSQMELVINGSRVEQILRTMRAHPAISIGAEYAEGFTTELPLRMDADLFFRV